jgi:hypothetical protein
MDEPDPDELTSPGTVDDPELEQQRARDAALREQESRLRSDTKFHEERDEQEARRHELAERLRDLPESQDRDDDD